MVWQEWHFIGLENTTLQGSKLLPYGDGNPSGVKVVLPYGNIRPLEVKKDKHHMTTLTDKA